MMKDLEDNLSRIESNILRLKEDYKELKEEYSQLLEKFQKLRNRYELEQKKSQELEEEQKKIKIAAAVAGNPDHNRLVKNHINRLTKEIDACISQIQNIGM